MIKKTAPASKPKPAPAPAEAPFESNVAAEATERLGGHVDVKEMDTINLWEAYCFIKLQLKGTKFSCLNPKWPSRQSWVFRAISDLIIAWKARRVAIKLVDAGTDGDFSHSWKFDMTADYLNKHRKDLDRLNFHSIIDLRSFVKGLRP